MCVLAVMAKTYKRWAGGIFMKVSDLKANSNCDTLELKIIEKGEVRDVRDGQLHVCSLKGKDDTGEVVVTLWNDDIDKVSMGDNIKIIDGWVTEFKGNLQVGLGKKGSLEVL